MTIAHALVRASAVLTHCLSPHERTLTRCLAISRTQSADPYARSDHVSGWSKFIVDTSTVRLSRLDEGPRLSVCASCSNPPLAVACMTRIGPP
jgi:hypothetical protein